MSGAVLFGTASLRAGSVVFNNIPSPLDPNYPSIGYEATSTTQVGSEINVTGGSGQTLSSASVLLSDWATQANNPGYGDSTGFDQALTLNIYNTNGSNPSLAGSLIGSVTETFHIAWLVPTGTDGVGPYYTVNGVNYHGVAQTATFDLSSADITVPDQFIYTLSFNTQNYGTNPTGVSGPYNSLNFGLVSGAPTVGSYANADDIFQASGWSGEYDNGAPQGLGVLQLDTGWTDFQPGVSFSVASGSGQTTAVPLPASVWSGLAMLGAVAALGQWKRTRLAKA
ncbi:MAG TPA: hypothetical protein VM008_21300 [Phycisphaerae bacterium]|nr:hypothetical protein [Phycisphaerae bacterium]